MKRGILLALTLMMLSGCETSDTSVASSSGDVQACPADVSQADRYKYPACDAACPADVSQADRYKYPACQ